jgi:hypothetical protein
VFRRNLSSSSWWVPSYNAAWRHIPEEDRNPNFHPREKFRFLFCLFSLPSFVAFNEGRSIDIVFTFRGKFAAVRKCTHKETGVEYAAKFIRKRRRAMDQRQDILHEVAVLKIAADSARIVRLHEVYETPTEMALILEL